MCGRLLSCPWSPGSCGEAAWKLLSPPSSTCVIGHESCCLTVASAAVAMWMHQRRTHPELVTALLADLQVFETVPSGGGGFIVKQRLAVGVGPVASYQRRVGR